MHTYQCKQNGTEIFYTVIHRVPTYKYSQSVLGKFYLCYLKCEESGCWKIGINSLGIWRRFFSTWFLTFWVKKEGYHILGQTYTERCLSDSHLHYIKSVLLKTASFILESNSNQELHLFQTFLGFVCAANFCKSIFVIFQIISLPRQAVFYISLDWVYI